MSARAFFREIDERWDRPATVRIPLHVIGCSALTLQVDYDRGTKDGDVLETIELTPEVRDRLLSLAGPASALRARHRMYLEIVGNGIPFLPQVPVWHRVDVGAPLGHFDVLALDVVDVVVSKLKRLNQNDLDDIEAMVERRLVPHERLIDRFRAAIDYNACDARAEDFPTCVDHLHQVERDIFAVAETAIDLPSWV